jgi:hypothetical protein
VPGLLLSAVMAETTALGILWKKIAALETELAAERKGRLQDRDRATRTFLKILEKESGVSLSDSEANSPTVTTG